MACLLTMADDLMPHWLRTRHSFFRQKCAALGLQEKRRTAKAEKLEKIRKGEKGSTATHRTKVTA